MKPSSSERIAPCPACGSDRVVPILYGYPVGSVVVPLLSAGKIVLGGCMVGPDDPNVACVDCQHRWRRKRARKAVSGRKSSSSP